MTASPSVRPGWVDDLANVVIGLRDRGPGPFAPPAGHLRRSAVLMVFGSLPEPTGPEPDRSRTGGDGTMDGGVLPLAVPPLAVPPADVLLTERAPTLREHAGQVAFPGGRIDPADSGPSAAALREAREETGLDPDGVEVIAELPDLFLPVSDFAVTPVLAWWRRPSPVFPVDPGEVTHVVRVPVAELVDPRNRFTAVHPRGFAGPGFRASGLFVWGFTAGLLDLVLALAGWARPWDSGLVRDVPVPSGPVPDGRTVK